MSMNIKEKAEKYYPDIWTKNMLIELVKAGKLTKDEYQEVTKEEYDD